MKEAKALKVINCPGTDFEISQQSRSAKSRLLTASIRFCLWLRI